MNHVEVTDGPIVSVHLRSDPNVSLPEEDGKSIRMEDFIRPFFEKLNEKAVAYLVMRNHQGYPKLAHKPDIGLLIWHRHVRLLMKAFGELCGELGYAFVLDTRTRQSVIMTAIRFGGPDNGQAGSRAIKVDARTYESLSLTRCQKVLRGFSYKVFYDEVKRRQVTQDGCIFYTFDQPDELVMLFKQWKRKGTEKYRQEILVAMADPAVERWFREATGITGGCVHDLIKSPGDEGYDPLLWRLVRYRFGPHTLGRILRTHWRALVIRLRRSRPGIAPIFYFSGPDGCGKTTLVEAVRSSLDQNGIRYKYFYSLKKVLRFVVKRVVSLTAQVGGLKEVAAPTRHATDGDNVARHVDRTHGGGGHGRWWRIWKRLVVLVSFADSWIGAMLAWLYRVQGYAVLVETSPYDMFIKYHMPEFAGIEKRFAPIVPRPNACFVLSATAQNIRERKAELGADEIAEYYRRLEKVFERGRVGNQRIYIRTDENPARCAAETLQHVVGAIGRSQTNVR